MFRKLMFFVIALVAGSLINTGIVFLFGKIFPIANPQNLPFDRLIVLFEAKHYLGPLLAHALGTFSSVFFYGVFTNPESAVPQFIFGALFFCGGAYMAWLLPAPRWFEWADLLFAYFPMAWAGFHFSRKIRK